MPDSAIAISNPGLLDERPVRLLGLDVDTAAKWLSVVVVVAYAALAWMMHPNQLEGDEQRYYQDAVNLTQGFFVADDHPRIFNGPGYPFFLYPFVSLGVPTMAIRFTGAFMIGLGAWFLYLAGRRLMKPTWALGLATWCSFHPNLMKQGHTLMTEPLTHLTLAVFLWAFIHAVQADGKVWRKWGLLAAVSIWWLAMTRVFMGHVITAMIGGSFLLMSFSRYRSAARRSLAVMLGALLLCAPYLRFTHSKTGSYFLWSTSAGELLYWLTSHENGENGHWYHEDEVMGRSDLAVSHAAFFKSIHGLGPLERETEFKRVALERIKADPVMFVRNWICNVSRLFFGFPRSLEVEKLTSLPLVVFNGSLLAGLGIGLLLAWMRRDPLSPVVVLCLLMAAFYTGGSTLAPALPRYFLGTVPVVALVAAVLLSRVPWSRLWTEERGSGAHGRR